MELGSWWLELITHGSGYAALGGFKMKAGLWTLLLLLVFSPILMAENLPDPESRGVWVTGNYLAGGPTAIEKLVQNVAAAHLNVIYIDVWYQGSTIYPSNVVSTAGGPSQNPSFVGTDPLQTLINDAHQDGIEVFAWFEYGLAVGMGSDSTQVPNILRLHPDWSMVQRDTTKHFDYDAGDHIYLFWVDPAVPAAADFMVNLFRECAQRYPDLDGIELDRLRYPGTDFSYSDIARQLYEAEYGIDPLTLSDRDTTWAEWRRKKVTDIVRRIYENVKSVNPSCVVSGAVDPWGLPGLPSDNLQEWNVWADSGYVDLLEPETYWDVAAYEAEVPPLQRIVPENFYLYTGIALNQTGSAENTITEIDFARQQGWEGEAIWYYGYLEQNGYSDSLRNSVYQTVTLSSHDDILIDNTTQGAFSTQGTWSLANGGYRGSYYVSTSSHSNSATYAFRILRSGRYSLYGFWSGDSSTNCRSVLVDVVSGSFSKVDTVDQLKGLDTWNFVDGFPLNSGDTVRVTVSGGGTGNVIADAFRLRRGIALQLEDEAVPDSSDVLLKFNQDLLNPLASCTRLYLSSTGQDSVAATAFIDNSDNSVLHVTVPAMKMGSAYTLYAASVVSAKYDTADFSVPVMYDPDSTVVQVDDSSPTQFTITAGSWETLNDTSAVGGSCRIIKQSTSPVKAEWAPFQIYQDGYYDVYASVPQVPYSLSTKCLYLVLNYNGSDSVITSQRLAVNEWLKLGDFQYKAGDVGGVMVSSLPGADTSQYLVADAVMLRRSVDIAGIKEGLSAPHAFRLFQNYPNPFNPTTIINFQLPTSGFVTLRIYDVIGRLVETLVDGTEVSGNHQVIFNGSRVSSGVYFCRLTAGDHSAVNKMLMIK